MFKPHITLCSKLTSFEHHSGVAHHRGPCRPQGLRPFDQPIDRIRNIFLTIHARSPKIYKGSIVHSDDRPSHYVKSFSGLQKGENDAPLRIHLALILGSKASVSQTWTQRWHVLVFPRDNEWPLSGESAHTLASSLGFHGASMSDH